MSVIYPLNQYRHQSYDLKHKELLEKMFESEEEEISERVYNPDEDDYIIKTRAKTNSETGTETETETENNIYSKIRFICKECHEELRSKVALTTHSYSHNRMYLENTEDFDINSSQNMREFYITDKGGNYIEDIDEATNYSLEEIKTVTSFVKLRVLNLRSRLNVIIRRELKKKLKLLKYFSILIILLKLGLKLNQKLEMKLKLKLKTISILRLGLYVKNVTKNLEVK